MVEDYDHKKHEKIRDIFENEIKPLLKDIKAKKLEFSKLPEDGLPGWEMKVTVSRSQRILENIFDL